MLRRISIIICLILPLAAFSAQPITPQQKIQQFIAVMVKKYHFKNESLQQLLARRKPNGDIIKRITFPYESKPWLVYRQHFITPHRIKNGVKYWKKHKNDLLSAQKQFGVPASVIVAIIGVESNYGQFSKHFNELDALTTLAFYYPKRGRFFQKELKQYLLLTREQKIDPTTLYGSYAGALGIPQFMPSSYKHYGVDFSGNGKVDLLNDHKDAIGSIANYLKKNGWRKHQAVAVPAAVTKSPAASQLKSRKQLAQWKKIGVNSTKRLNPALKAKLIAMGDGSNYWLVFRNFRAIMSYNPRIPYAMVVYQLSTKIQKAYEQA